MQPHLNNFQSLNNGIVLSKRPGFVLVETSTMQKRYVSGAIAPRGAIWMDIMDNIVVAPGRHTQSVGVGADSLTIRPCISGFVIKVA